jgi:thiol-disulfide isomerase/thioredoxin
MNSQWSPSARAFRLATLIFGLGVSLSQAQPANDMFANRTVITGTNIVVSGSNVGATREAGEPYHAGEAGGASVWWSWTAPFSGSATIATSGSSFDTLLAVYTNTTLTSLVAVAMNDDDPEAYDYTSKVEFDAISNQTYQIAVDGYSGDSGSIQLSVVLVPPPPPRPAPAWAVPDPYGAMIYSSNYAGKVMILDFWATWCGPCKAEIPDLVSLQTKYGGDGLVVVGANGGWSGDTPQVVQDFLASFTPAINYPIVMADAGMVQAYGPIPYIPSTFIIDRQNLIRANYVGTQPGTTLERQIIPLLYSNARLGCSRSGDQMRLCWPTNALSFALESAIDPAHPVWSTWPAAPSVNNGSNVVQVPATDSARLFRLRMPY